MGWGEKINNQKKHLAAMVSVVETEEQTITVSDSEGMGQKLERIS